jgi:hypothetical protein
MYRLTFAKRSQSPDTLIVIATLALYVAVGLVAFDNIMNVYAVEDLNVEISIDDDEIERGNTQKIIVTVTEDGNSNDEISGADVKLTVYPPETDSTTAQDETDEEGKAKFDVKISDDANYGTYDVKVKVSKDGFGTKTEDSSFEVTGSGSNDKGDNNHDDEMGYDNDNSENRDANNGGGNGDRGESSSVESKNQALSQGNACGNGVLSTNILCQNVVNQLQGDGNAINIIAVQTGEEAKNEVENSVSSPPVSPSSSVMPGQHAIQQPHVPPSESPNYGSAESIVDRYVQARLNHAVETRLNYLR